MTFKLKSSQHISGLKELSDKLEKIGKAAGSKAMRNAAVAATTPVMRDMRAAAPVGKKEHRTYKGRLVAPTFLRRSIKRKSWIDKKWGSVKVIIGVASEAYYGVQFLDKGTKFIPAQPWFEKTFEKNASRMVAVFGAKLGTQIKKAAKL